MRFIPFLIGGVVALKLTEDPMVDKKEPVETDKKKDKKEEPQPEGKSLLSEDPKPKDKAAPKEKAEAKLVLSEVPKPKGKALGRLLLSEDPVETEPEGKKDEPQPEGKSLLSEDPETHEGKKDEPEPEGKKIDPVDAKREPVEKEEPKAEGKSLLSEEPETHEGKKDEPELEGKKEVPVEANEKKPKKDGPTPPPDFLQMKMSTKRYDPHNGFFNPMETGTLTNDDGEMDLYTIDDPENDIDPNTYAGENLERESINDHVTHFGRLHGKPLIVRKRHAGFSSSDLMQK